jgi:hypothetical protein
MKRLLFRLKKWYLGLTHIRQCDNLFVSKDILDRLTGREYITILKTLDHIFGRHQHNMKRMVGFKRRISEYSAFENRVIFVVTDGSEMRHSVMEGGYYFIYIGIDYQCFYHIVRKYIQLFIQYKEIGALEEKSIIYYFNNNDFLNI